jgi:hypothetical protein
MHVAGIKPAPGWDAKVRQRRRAANPNHRLLQCNCDDTLVIDSISFNITMSGGEARLYVSWKQTKHVLYVAKVQTFSLCLLDAYLMLTTWYPPSVMYHNL